MTRFLLLLTFMFLTIIPGIHKLLGDIPPAWFSQLFQDSLIGKIPTGVQSSFYLIVFLELVAGTLFFVALVKKEFCSGSNLKFSNYGLWITQGLFLILFFGSFLIENYDNGFNDFVYLIALVLVQHLFFTVEQKGGV